MGLRHAPLVLLLAAIPRGADGQAVVMSPTSGTSNMHFFLSGAGWPKCPGTGCDGSIDVHVDGVHVYHQGSVNDFFFDLNTIIPPPGGGGPPMNPGQHTVKVDGFSICGECTESLCLTSSYTVVDSVSDPWALIQAIINTTPGPQFGDIAGPVLRFFPAGPGFAACDTVHLIQVMQEVGVYPSGRARFLTAAEQVPAHFPVAFHQWADSLDAWTTPSHHHLDIHRLSPRRMPYQTIGKPYEVSKPGRSGPSADTARVVDVPFRADSAYADSVERIVLNFEMNAICVGGVSGGQYLGRCVWQWERQQFDTTTAGRLTFWPPQTDVGQPSQQFREAVALWAAHKGFQLPTPAKPTKGGTLCP